MNNISQQELKKFNRRRWIIWVPVALAILTPYFHRTVIGVVADNLMRDFSISHASELGAMASIYFYTYAAMQMPAGILADRFGPRRTITAALIVASLGAAVFGWAGSMGGLYAGRFLSSLGVSLIYIGIVKIHAEWFRLREFGTMTGMIVIAGSTGFLLSATPLAFVVELFDWRAAFYVIASYSLIMAVICWLLVRDRPTEVGLPAIAAIEAQEEGAVRTHSSPAGMSIAFSIKAVLMNPHTWWPFLAAVSVYGVFMAFMGIWAVPYFMQIYGMPRVEAANYVLAIAIGTMTGGPLIGIISDRMGLRRAPYILVTAFFMVIWLTLTVWNHAKPPIWALYPLCFGIGLGMSGVNLAVACVKESNPPQFTGVAAGFSNSGAFVGAALMQPAFGGVLDRYWQGMIENGVRIYPIEAYQAAFWFCAAVLALGLVFTFLIHETYCGQENNVFEKT